VNLGSRTCSWWSRRRSNSGHLAAEIGTSSSLLATFALMDALAEQPGVLPAHRDAMRAAVEGFHARMRKPRSAGPAHGRDDAGGRLMQRLVVDVVGKTHKRTTGRQRVLWRCEQCPQGHRLWACGGRVGSENRKACTRVDMRIAGRLDAGRQPGGSVTKAKSKAKSTAHQSNPSTRSAPRSGVMNLATEVGSWRLRC